MQVFLPYSDFVKSVSCLDPKRLGNQIYREALTLIKGGWRNHPASKIWFNHKYALAKYCIAGLDELSRRGRYYHRHYQFFLNILNNEVDTGNPRCVGIEEFHSSHRAALLFKDFNWYSQFGWKEEPKIDYIWPI